MKKLLVLALALVASPAFADTDAFLNLTGNVATQLAIDIDVDGDPAGACEPGNHECSQDLGDLTQALDKKIARLGVLSNNGYQIKMSSDNGALKGLAGTSSADGSLEYSLAWEDVQFMADVPQSAAPVDMLATEVPSGTYECSLIDGCPQTPSARHDVYISHAGDVSLPAGDYADKVTFTIEEASGI